MQKKLITIVGPTAIGKTALSIKLAQHFGCEIVSCDSRQFFREMTIGTAVPSAEELSAVRHHFIQNISVLDTYNVGDFERDAIQKISELHQNNDYVILVGGSGLYANAVLNGIDFFPEIDAEIRTKVNTDFENFGLIYLQNKLETLDNHYYNKLKIENPQTLQNPQRMKRFVEVCVGTQQPYSDFLQKNKTIRSFDAIEIGLTAKRELIYERINQRVDMMMTQGLLNEVENLVQYKELNALQTVGYRELFDFLTHKNDLNEAVETIKKNTRNFAKRQETWFKRSQNTKWFDFEYDLKEILEYINHRINK